MFMLVSTHERLLKEARDNLNEEIASLNHQLRVIREAENRRLYDEKTHAISKQKEGMLSPPNNVRDVEFNRLVALNQASSQNDGSNDILLGGLAVATVFDTPNNSCSGSSYSSFSSSSSYSSDSSSSSSSSSSSCD